MKGIENDEAMVKVSTKYRKVLYDHQFSTKH